MGMQRKLTGILLIVGLLSAGTVGGVAYWILMQRFQQSVMDEAYGNFQQDVQAFLDKHGGWEQGIERESFHQFVARSRPNPSPLRRPPPFLPAPLERHNPPPFLPAPIDRHNQPPFRFLVLSPTGRVLKGLEEYPAGSQAPPAVLTRTRPVKYRDRVEVLIAPIGDPILSPLDQGYLNAMRQALMIGIAVAVLLALLIGVVSGRRMSLTLRNLTAAIHAMGQERESECHVSVTSDDELGELASAFNRMNSELSQAHRELRESSELVQKQADELRELSIKDPLTQLFNRRYYDEQAQMLYAQALRYGQPLTVMVGDLDHFKRINDQLSHAVGDAVLRQVAKLMCNSVRKSDVVARYGGEEFVILFPNSTLEQSAHCCETLRQNIESYPWHTIDPALTVTISMGLSDNLALGGVEKMIAQADRQLYTAKHGGRNCVMPAVAAA